MPIRRKLKFCLLVLATGLWAGGASGGEELNPRIIALAPHVVENLFHIGAGDLIIATTDHADYPEQAKQIPRVGNYARLQIEKIIALQPDYVIAWRGGNPPEDLKRLEQLGIKIVDSNPKLLADVAGELRQLGQLTGREKHANKLADEFESNLTSLKQRYASSTHLKTFYELWPKPLTTVAKGSWPQQIMQLCGAENLFEHLKGEYPMVSEESVLAANPEVIVQPHDSARPFQSKDWSQWDSVPAVAKGAFVHPDADKLHRMTPRMLDEAELFCERLDRYREGL